MFLGSWGLGMKNKKYKFPFEKVEERLRMIYAPHAEKMLRMPILVEEACIFYEQIIDAQEQIIKELGFGVDEEC